MVLDGADASDALWTAARRDADYDDDAPDDDEGNAGFRQWLVEQLSYPPPCPWPQGEAEVRSLSLRPAWLDDEDDDENEDPGLDEDPWLDEEASRVPGATLARERKDHDSSACP